MSLGFSLARELFRSGLLVLALVLPIQPQDESVARGTSGLMEYILASVRSLSLKGPPAMCRHSRPGSRARLGPSSSGSVYTQGAGQMCTGLPRGGDLGRVLSS